MNLENILAMNRICCPECGNISLCIRKEANVRTINCTFCGINYNVFNETPLMIPVGSALSISKENIQKFWGTLYSAAYGDHAELYTEDSFGSDLMQLQKLFQHREHLAVTEMPVDRLNGLMVLEIGPGAGAHSALFASKGAIMTSLDITLNRVVETNRKFSLLGRDDICFALQGDAEMLPFPDNHFDIVYSNGVLHHTPDTPKTIEEVYRVLKPGGLAVIMLYARHSFLFWVNMFLLKGILLGNIFRHKNWLGRTTEWMSIQKQKVYNPETKVYSAKDIRRLFHQFSEVEIRKGSFGFPQIPVIGKYFSNFLGIFTGFNDAGKLVYDRPWRNETRLELLLGRVMGFALNIRAGKR